jgi:bifunctional DNase/RNase
MKKRTKEKFYRSLCIGLFVVIGILIFIIFLPKLHEVKELAPLFFPESSILGFEKVDRVDVVFTNNEGLVTLTSGCYELTASVDAPQALSIQNALQKKSAERPNAHDLAKDVFNTLDIRVLMVKITELRGNSYFAKILLKQKNTFLNFDVRPSDGIAIALRMESPIYINSSLLKQQGKYIC